MRASLINKNLSLYYGLGKERAHKVACASEKVILVFGRDQVGGVGNEGLRILLA